MGASLVRLVAVPQHKMELVRYEKAAEGSHGGRTFVVVGMVGLSGLVGAFRGGIMWHALLLTRSVISLWILLRRGSLRWITTAIAWLLATILI